jgi:hypothetical protein
MSRRAFFPALVVAIVVSTHAAANGAGAGSRAELTFTRVNGLRYSVWVANADGSGARRVVAGAYGGRLSSDGRWLAYSRQPLPDGLTSLRVVDLATGRARRIGGARGTQWSPGDPRLAVTTANGLFLVDPASGKRRQLARGGDIAGVTFSPDGRALAFARDNGRVQGEYRSDIYVVRLSDGVITRLTRDGHSDSPLWGPEWIVYQHFRWIGGLSPQGRLWLMRADGSAKHFFARGSEGLRRGYPVFGVQRWALSTDGRRLLACQAFEFGCPRVSFTIPDGKRFGFPKVGAFERNVGATAEDLSPDGTRVLLDVGNPQGGEHSIYEVPFRGGKLRLLVADAIEASWRR